MPMIIARHLDEHPSKTPPRHGDVDDRAEEEEEDELEYPALHGNILRQIEVHSAIVEPFH